MSITLDVDRIGVRRAGETRFVREIWMITVVTSECEAAAGSKVMIVSMIELRKDSVVAAF